MKLTNERIFANDTDMMFWQQDNCTQCAKAVWYNARLGRCPKHNCALQRDMEAQAGGEMEINERSLRMLHGVKRCPLFKAMDATPDDATPVIDAYDFAKGKPIEQPKKEAPKKEVAQTFSEAEIKAAEKRMFDTIWNNEIAPNVGNAIKSVQAPMSEARFKELARMDAQTMLETFTWEENMMIAFVPLIISKIAWVYADKALKYCADNRISEFKKLGCSIKELRQKYLDLLRIDLDFKHIHHIDSQTLQFMDECNYDLTILWYQVNQYIKIHAPGMQHEKMRTDAAVAVLMVRYLKAHNRRMDAVISAKMGRSQSIDNPKMIALEKLMMQYFPEDFKLETNANLDLCGKIFANNLSKIEFEVTND